MENFLRPFSEEEFNERFNQSGLEDIARTYCREECDKWFNDILEEEIDRFVSVVDGIDKLRKNRSTDVSTVRDAAWADMLHFAEIDEYIFQRKMGHGHLWSKFYAENLIENAVLHSTYKDLCKVDSRLAEAELEILVGYLVKDRDSVFEEYLRHGLSRDGYDTIDEAIAMSEKFYENYRRLTAKGYDHYYARMYSELSIREEYADEYCIYFAEIYSRERASGYDGDAAYRRAEDEAQIIFDKVQGAGWSLDKSKTYAHKYIDLVYSGENTYHANKLAYAEVFNEDEI